MGKKIILAILGVILVGFILGAFWVFSQREQDMDLPQESFIPENAAVVFHVHEHATLSPNLKEIFMSDIAEWQQKSLWCVLDSLAQGKLVEIKSLILALRIEGRETLRALYILNRSGLFSRGDVCSFLKNMFGKERFQERDFDRFRIYTFSLNKQNIYFAVVGGKVLVSDSELYIEDALKQLDREETPGHENQFRYKNINRYLSPAAGVNVFLNTSCFVDLLPLFVQRDFLSRYSDFTRWFKWGALDVDLKDNGVSVNGFLQYAGMKGSFAQVLKGQQTGESRLETILPSRLKAAGFLKLSDMKTYLSALEKYRLDGGKMREIRKRKQEYARLLGKEYEYRWNELLQGDFAKGLYGKVEFAGRQSEGIMVARLKSGSLAEALLRDVLDTYCRKVNINMVSLEREFRPDKDKIVKYYKWPLIDFAETLWGDWWGKLAVNYVLIQDNYLLFASSESVIQDFVKDYVRQASLSDADWYKKIKEKLSSKYTWMYVADFPVMSSYYQHIAVADFKRYLQQNQDRLSGFSTLGLQWMNEGDMIYHSLFLSTEEVERQQAQVMWQTKLDAKVTMKPVVVKNHNTGERELFVQDEKNVIYLINDIGRVLWKQPVEGRINSQVYQVDFYKNGKLQYLFSTPTHLYLIDRNGEFLPRYPLAFKSRCEMGVTLCDYEQDRNYRIFVPGEDRKIYLYDLKGDVVKGWGTPRCDNPIYSKVSHFRVGGKDYIVCVDRYRVYILDRRGRERAKVPTLFDVIPGTMLHKIREVDGERLLLTTASGEVVKIDFNGKKIQPVKGVKVGSEGLLNVADLDNDKVDELLVGEESVLAIYNLQGVLLQKSEWEGRKLGFPYVYRFSMADIRVGLVDRQHQQVLLVGQKQLAKGFPMEGTSPFSIAFLDNGKAGFYLFVANGESLLKYQVQR